VVPGVVTLEGAQGTLAGQANVITRAEGDTILPGSKSAARNVRIDQDLELVLEVKAGRAAAFGDLVERHQRSVYGIVSRIVHNRDDVDDVVQEVFVLAYQSIRSFREESSFSTWLHRIAVNTALKHLKKMKVRHAISIDDPETGLAATLSSDNGRDHAQEAALDHEQNLAVRRAVDSLPEKHRAVVVLHYFENFSCEEIAQILGCSVGTVWSRLHYAGRKLRDSLEWLKA